VLGGLSDYDSRQYYEDEYGVRAVDAGFQAVLESVDGNRKDSIVLVRGITDYGDGTSADKATPRRRSGSDSSERDWRAYSALTAAGVMKCIVLDIVAPTEDDDDD